MHLLCVLFFQRGKLFFFFWDKGFPKLGQGKKTVGFAMLPTLECSGSSQAQSHHSDLFYFQPGLVHPTLGKLVVPHSQGGRFINAELHADTWSAQRTAAQNFWDLPASASQVAVTTCHLYSSCIFWGFSGFVLFWVFFFFPVILTLLLFKFKN